MAWTIRFTPSARKSLKRLDRTTASRLISTLERNLVAHADPRAFGKALAGEMAGLWRYRVGDYRLIVRIEDERLVVLVIEVAHRREVYR